MIEKNVSSVMKCDVCRKVLTLETDGFIISGDIYASVLDNYGVPNKILATSSGVPVNTGDLQVKVLCKEHFLESLGIPV
jgi:hypothetical protein